MFSECWSALALLQLAMGLWDFDNYVTWEFMVYTTDLEYRNLYWWHASARKKEVIMYDCVYIDVLHHMYTIPVRNVTYTNVCDGLQAVILKRTEPVSSTRSPCFRVVLHRYQRAFHAGNQITIWQVQVILETFLAD